MQSANFPSDWRVETLEGSAVINPESLGSGTLPDFEFSYIDIASVDRGVVDWQSVTNQKYATAPSRARRIVKPNDILLSTVRPGLQGHTFADWQTEDGVICSTGFAVLRAGESVYPRYLYHLVFSHIVGRQLRRRETGSNYPAVREGDVREILIPIPPPKEQRRIAEILDTADATIQQTETVIAKLKQVKAGLLHDLLTRGLDGNGHLRDPKAHPEQFKETEIGRVPREWRIGNIDELAENRDSERIPVKQSVRAEMKGIYPYYGASGIIDWVDDYLFDGDFVLLGEDGANVITRHQPLAFRVTGKIWVNNHAHVYEPYPHTDIRFLTELLEATDYAPVVGGSAQPKLTQRALKQLSIPIPPFQEQKAIGDILEAHDARIRAEVAYRDKLQKVKRALMQDLLTGRVRV